MTTQRKCVCVCVLTLERVKLCTNMDTVTLAQRATNAKMMSIKLVYNLV